MAVQETAPQGTLGYHFAQDAFGRLIVVIHDYPGNAPSPQNPYVMGVYGLDGSRLGIDAISLGAVGIDTVHDRIHDSIHYTSPILDTSVNNAAPKYVSITTPNTAVRGHFVAVVAASSATLVEFFETPTITVAGAARTPLNNDRNSANAATLTVEEDPTVTVDGTLLFATRIAGGNQAAANRISADVAQRTEWILKQNETYIVKATPDANGVEISIVSTWYEV